jgi:flagellar L-ring protein precursor FlgH
MKRIIFLILFLSTSLVAQNMTENAARSLFADHKAAQVGDAVTILIVESSSAVNGAETSTSRDSKLGASAGFQNNRIFRELPYGESVSVSGTTANGFKGTGSTSNKGSVQAKLSAKIVEIDDNGNLRIEGTRNILINKEEQIIKVSGTIRPQDISPDNTIYSYNISDAVISYKGEGAVSSVQGPGWFTKFLHWLF